jgi:hypothetical protein
MTFRVLEIDPAETFYSLRDRLRQGGRGRVILVAGANAPLTGLDLVLLRRLAERERLDVGLVTPDGRLARQARALGLPAFATLTAAEYYRPGWRRGRPRERLGWALGQRPHPSDALPRQALWPLVLLVALLALGLLAVAAIALPQAAITLRPAALPAQVIFDLAVDPQLTAAEGDAIPGHPVELSQTWETRGPATGDAAADRERLRAQARQGLAAAAPDLLAARLGPDELLAPDTVQVAIVGETFDRSGEMLRLRQSAELTGLAVAAADVAAAAYPRLAAALPDGFAPEPDSLRVNGDTTGTPGNRLQVTARVNGRAEIDAAALAKQLRGQPSTTAAGHLAGLPLAEPPSLTVWPGWWGRWPGRLPLRAERIDVTLLP